jgi:hypothetical protein
MSRTSGIMPGLLIRPTEFAVLDQTTVRPPVGEGSRHLRLSSRSLFRWPQLAMQPAGGGLRYQRVDLVALRAVQSPALAIVRFGLNGLVRGWDFVAADRVVNCNFRERWRKSFPERPHVVDGPRASLSDEPADEVAHPPSEMLNSSNSAAAANADIFRSSIHTQYTWMVVPLALRANYDRRQC